jgi:hypothetical protein
MSDADLVRAIRERVGANDSLFYAHRVFAEVDALARRHGLPFPRSVLELGPGVNLGALFAFAASGARAAGVDVAPLPAPPDGFYESLPTIRSGSSSFRTRSGGGASRPTAASCRSERSWTAVSRTRSSATG